MGQGREEVEETMNLKQEVRVVERSWGIEYWSINDAALNVCGKYMVMSATGSSRIERHLEKDETFFTISGVVRIELFGYGDEPQEEETILLRTGEAFRIRPLRWHRFSAAEEATTFFETSSAHSDLDVERREIRRPE